MLQSTVCTLQSFDAECFATDCIYSHTLVRSSVFADIGTHCQCTSVPKQNAMSYGGCVATALVTVTAPVEFSSYCKYQRIMYNQVHNSTGFMYVSVSHLHRTRAWDRPCAAQTSSCLTSLHEPASGSSRYTAGNTAVQWVDQPPASVSSGGTSVAAWW